MYQPTDPRLPSSLHKVESKSRLTLNFNPANLPVLPNLVPPLVPVTTVPSNNPPYVGEENRTTIEAPPVVVPPCPIHVSAQVPISSGRPTCSLRSRYVLPPQFSQKTESPPVSSGDENTAPQTTFPNPPPAQSEEPFSTMTILPTPSYFDVSATSPEEPASGQAIKEAPQPVSAHWFYSTRTATHGVVWWPFDRVDSNRLEAAATTTNLLSVEGTTADSSNPTVAVRGGRYDVFLRERVCKPIYWTTDDEEAGEVRRVTWFYRPQDEQRVLPFSEKMSTTLEEYYRRTVESDSWGEKLLLPVDDNPDDMATYIFHNDRAMVQYRNGCFSSDSALNLGGTDGPSSFALCSYLYRGLRDDLESQIPDGDPRPIEHVVFVVHGIGSIYNMRGEGLIECVNDMRKTATSLLASHFADAKKGRVEFLPVRWHSSLHSETTGINNQLKRVTLRSIPKLRNYTNGTLTDILFYTSPKYCQHIIDTVASTIKHLRQLFLRRNPDFTGDFSVAGHSLGSVIVFDLLAHQRRTPSSTPSLSSFSAGPEDDDDWSLVDGTSPYPLATSELASQLTLAANLSEDQLRRVMNVVSGAVGVSRSTGVGLPMVNYPQLGFPLNTCFLLGSPLSIFLTARGTDRLPHDFRLPSCSACVNVFHPFDPVAYRLETMIVPDFKHCAVLMPHHKGRKRIHLELKDNIARVSADITSRVYQSLRSTWRTLQEFASAHTAPVETEASATDESDAIKQVLSRLSDGVGGESRSKGGCNENDDGEDGDEDNDDDDDETTDSTAFPSQLNQGRRIDYVLQEGPLESLNDYLFALSSHAVYWDSQDCVLFMLNQIFTNAAASMPTGVAAPHEHPSTSNQNALTVAGLRGTGTLTRRASPRGELVGATTPTGLQHSASIPVFGQTPSGLPHNHPQHYLPWQTPLFNPSPAPSTTSLRSQHAEPNRAGQSAFEADAPRFADEVKTASLIEIDLAP